MSKDKIINDYLKKNGWRIKENSNFSYSWSGLLSHVADNTMANYTLRNMPKESSKAHRRGDIHIHDLNSYWIPYCHGGDLLHILSTGIRSASITSKPAKHLDTAVDHIVNYIYMSQLEFAGAQALSDINTLLAPFVHYDKLGRKAVKQSVQRLIYNLNFESRQAFQTPFSNFSFNVTVPQYFKEMPVVIGGEMQDRTYAEFADESDLILEEFCDILLEKDANNRPFTFPIPTINLINGVDWSSPTISKVLKVSSELGSFYYMNYVGTGIPEDTVRAMCCRLMLDMDDLPPGGGLWNFSGGTGSLGVVSLNMSRLGYLSKSEDDLFDRLDHLLDVSKDFLMFKDKHIRKSLHKGLLPFSKFYGLNLDRYFRTIGVIGLNEMCENFLHVPIINEPESVPFVGKVLTHIRDWTKRTQGRTKKLWNLEMTPGEGSSYRLARIDKNKYKNIYTLGTKNAPYYTTLIVPPLYDVPMTKLAIEEQLLPIFTGGTVSRNYIGEKVPVQGIRTFVEFLTGKNLPYFDITATFGVCNKCNHFAPGVDTVCPKCGDNMDVYSRVVGYYRQSSKYNVGKLQEFKDRTYLTSPVISGHSSFPSFS